MKYPAQQLTEYALPIALIAIVAIVGLGQLGGSISSSLGNVIQTGTAPPQPLGINGGISKLATFPGATTITIDLGNGKPVTLSRYPSDLSKAVETLGADGTTERLLANLESFIDQLVANEEISPAEANQLRELANQGHKIALVEQEIVWNGQIYHKDKSAFRSTPISFPVDGVTGKREKKGFTESFTEIDFHGDPKAGHPITPELKPYVETFLSSDYNADNGYAGNTLFRFLELYAQADQGTALRNPGVKKVVESLFQDIFTVSDTFASATSALISDDVPEMPYQLNSFSADLITRSDSNGICASGGENNKIMCTRDGDTEQTASK